MQTGIKNLDKEIDINGGNLIVLGARPAIGKSTFATNILSNIAIKQNEPVLYYNLETSKEEIENRFIIINGMIEESKFRKSKIPNIKKEDLTTEEWDRIAYGKKLYKTSKIFINDTPGISIDEICKQARKMKLEQNIKFIVIDYLQLIKYNGEQCISNNLQMEEILKRLNLLSRELNITILVLSQISREVEKRENHRPILTDFSNNKSSIETYADIILFLYRDGYYNSNTDMKNIAEIIIVKNPLGNSNIEIAWLPEYLKFGNLLKVKK